MAFVFCLVYEVNIKASTFELGVLLGHDIYNRFHNKIFLTSLA